MRVPGRPAIAVLALFLLALPIPSFARTWSVPAVAPTIQAGLDSAAAGDTVSVACGVYHEHDLVMKAGVVLRSGTGDPSCVVIEADSLGRVLTCSFLDSTAVIEGLTLSEGMYAGVGGGVYIYSSSPLFRNCRFAGNEGSYGGGSAVYSGSDPRFLGCAFEGNRASDWGGGLYVSTGCSARFEDCSWAENVASYGDGIYVYRGDVELFRCVMEDQDGIAIRARGEDAKAHLDSCRIERCGEAIYGLESEKITALHSEFLNNTNRALYTWENKVLVLRECLFQGNVNEGAYFQLADSAEVRSCEFRGNGGRGLRAYADLCEIVDCDFLENEGGGAMISGSLVAYVDSCDFLSNLEPEGGGVYCTPGSLLVVSRCRFEGNAWEGMRCRNVSSDDWEIRVTQCAFDSNPGYGIYCYSSSPVIDSCTFTGNGEYGIGCYYSSDATIRSCTFTDAGCGVRCRRSSPAIESCTFFGHTHGSSAYGTGVYSWNDSHPTMDRCIVAFGLDAEGVRVVDSSSVALTCCDIYGNRGGDWVQEIAGQLGQDGNISADPLLRDPAGGDFTIYSNSPCAPDSNPACGLIGARPVGGDPPAAPRTFLVNAEGTGDYGTIQDALAASYHGDLIELADGTYTGTGNRGIHFLGKSVTLKSESGDPAACVIDCEDETFGIGFWAREDSAAVVENLSIVRANGNEAGALYCIQSSPTVSGCAVHDCYAQLGAAMYCESASPLVTGCTFVDNRNWNWMNGHGGAIHVRNGSFPRIENSILAFTHLGEAIDFYTFGGDSCAVLLTCCDLFGNTVSDWCDSIADQLGANGNIHADPLFCDLGEGDLTLRDTSPCAAANHPACGTIGAFGVGCAAPPGPRTITVRADGSGDEPDIQSAIHASLPGDTIAMENGVFTGEGNQVFRLYGKAVVLRSASGDPDSCVIESDGLSNCVSLVHGETEATRIEDLTIQNGGTNVEILYSSPVLSGCRINGYNDSGSGIYVSGGFPLIERCDIARNGLSGIDCYKGSPTVRSTIIRGNGRHGLRLYESKAVVESCMITGNDSYSMGAGIYVTASSLYVGQSTIAGNREHDTYSISAWGGGIFLTGPDNRVDLERTVLWGNCGPGGAGEIGMASSIPDTLDITNCLIDTAGIEPDVPIRWHGSNVFTDPLFCEAVDCAATPTDSGVYHVDAASPCVDPNVFITIGAYGEGCDVATVVAGADPDLPLPVFSLSGNAPNPFNPSTEIRFSLPRPGPARLEIVDVAGRSVRTLFDGPLPAGSHARHWDGRNDAGRAVASGVYFIRLRAAGESAVRKAILIR